MGRPLLYICHVIHVIYSPRSLACFCRASKYTLKIGQEFLDIQLNRNVYYQRSTQNILILILMQPRQIVLLLYQFNYNSSYRVGGVAYICE